MNKLLILVIVLLTTFLSYVVYAVSQQSNQKKSANEVISDIFNAQTDDLGDQTVADKKLQRSGDSQPSADVAVNTRLENANLHQLRAVKGTANPAPLQLTISPVRDDQGKCAGYFEIEFTNTSDVAVKLLKPLDGSFYGWHQPHYKFHIESSEDAELELANRCKLSGLWANTEFPKNYLVELPAKKSTKITGCLPYVVSESGDYTVSLEYIYDFQNVDDTLRGTGEETWNQPVEGVWEGRVKSNEITLQLEKNN